MPDADYVRLSRERQSIENGPWRWIYTLWIGRRGRPIRYGRWSDGR